MFANGHQRDVPVIVGTNRDEGTLFMGDGFQTPAQLSESMQATYGEQAPALMALYAPGPKPDVRMAANRFLTDTWFLSAARVALVGMAKVKSPAWQYHFTKVNPARPAMGATHGAEIGYAFNNGEAANAPGGSADANLATAMIGHWTQFAKTGNPNGPGLADWPAFEAPTRSYLT